LPQLKNSSRTLYQKFLEYYEDKDFPGMDMARKFIQMGMARSKRYANYKGGRKYVDGKEDGRQIEKSTGHERKEEKEMASLVFKEVLEKWKAHGGYQELKMEFLKIQKEWESARKIKPQLKVEDEGKVKVEVD
jgi:hypothetical protein